ncbi:MAG: SpoIIE family protein phosphatase, partial [Candidatus Aureabacteria bacterium]|nr:SpoIIE family protein phosphatase [Candidatus Auribacterota bacterium]
VLLFISIDSLDIFKLKVEKIATDSLRQKAESLIQLKAESVAREIGIYIRNNPVDLEKNLNYQPLMDIAVQDVGTTGYTDIFDATGRSLMHPNKDVVGRNYAEWEVNFPQMWQLVKEAIKNGSSRGYYTFLEKNSDRPKEKYLCISSVPGTDYFVCASTYIDEFFQPLEKLRQEINSFSSLFRKKAALITAGIMMIFCLLAFFISRYITNPIAKLAVAVSQLGKGNFTSEVHFGGSREISMLSDKYNEMLKDLRRYIDEVTVAAKEKERMRSELKIARDVQRQMLPEKLPEFENCGQYALFGLNDPAEQVGGDLYDFIKAGKSALGFAIGDVSGKGIPASLFMMQAITLLRYNAPGFFDTSLLLSRLNDEICMHNPSGMFITLIYAVVDLNTGVLNLTNAGHNYPLLIRSGELVLFEGEKNIPIGIKGGVPYRQDIISLKEGDTLIFYTDGITEAQNGEKELYGDERLMKLVKENIAASPETMADRIMQGVKSFRSSARQSDDITLVIFRYEGGAR